MGVRSVDQDIANGNFQFMLNPTSELGKKFFAHIRQHSLTDFSAAYRRNVHGNDDHSGFAVVQYQCLSGQWIKNYRPWSTGMFMRWLKERSKGSPRVNAELKELFEAPAPAIAGELRLMLPERLAAQVPAQTT